MRDHNRWLVLLAALLVCGGLVADPSAGAAGVPEPGDFDVRLTVGDDSRLSISTYPTWTYDGRAGAGYGTLDPISSGRYRLHMKAGDIAIPALELFPGLGLKALAIEIVPRSIEGTVDLCSGEVALAFDATFRPKFAPRMSVQVTTEISTTEAGAPMDGLGNLRLAGTAEVSKTGDFLTDRLLRLPAPAVADLEAHLEFLRDLPTPTCPGVPPVPSDTGQMTVRPGSRLLISRFPAFGYQARGAGGTGTLTPTADPAVYELSISEEDLVIPPLLFVPGFDAMRVDISAHGIAGTVDVCTGEVHLAFDATFQPVIGTFRPSAISVVTDLTTETSTGHFQTFTGTRMNHWGDVRLVGVAKIPRTGDPLVDWLLSLPTDAVADLAVHLDVPHMAGCP